MSFSHRKQQDAGGTECTETPGFTSGFAASGKIAVGLSDARRSRPKIAHCLDSLGLGGAQQIVKYLVSEGTRGPFEHVVYTGGGGVFLSEVEETGTRVKVITRHLPKFDPGWIARLAAAMRTDGVDLVHTHLFGDSLHGLIAARYAGRLPVVMTLHNDTQGFTGIQLSAYRRMIPHTARVVACSISAQHSFEQIIPGAVGRIETIPNGLGQDAVPVRDADRERMLRSEFNIADNALIVGALGRMVEQKGFPYLLDAFAEVRASGAPAAHLLLIGQGPDLDRLRRRARDLGIADFVHFTGFRERAREIIPCLDVLAFSSLYEGLPVTLLEGMASARCIVTTSAPGLGDVIEHRKTGILVAPRDSAALARGLLSALQDAELREFLGNAALRVFLERYTAERMVERYQALYGEILADRDRGGA